MSYDITFGPPPGVPIYPEDTWRNYTSNVSPMWAAALGGETLGDRIDRAVVNEDLIEPLRGAIAAMKADPELYRGMNPANGWGDYDGALQFLVWMLANCEAVPMGTCSVWR